MIHMQKWNVNYTIPSDNRELQLMIFCGEQGSDYTIPSDNRELQQFWLNITTVKDYTIPSDNRKLQQSRYQDHILAIIPYQVIMRKIRKVYWNYGKTVINLYTTTKNRKPCKSKFPVSQQKSARRDSNPRPRPWQGRAPPTEPLAHASNA